jgi:hypothetical protein
VFYALAIVVGAGIICWAASVFHTQKASLQWPKVSGTIVQSERPLVGGGRNAHYRADVTYSYKVNGTHYVSSQISLWSRDLSSYNTINEPFVANHRPGTAVDVYFEPSHPENAVLIPGPDEGAAKFEIGAGAAVMIMAMFEIIRLIPRRRRMVELLNAPDAETRTQHLRRSEIEAGTTAFVRHAGMAFLFTIVAMLLLLGRWLNGPPALQPRQNPEQLLWGLGCIAGAVFFVVRGLKKGRSAECPLCGTFLNKEALSSSICPGCKTRIVFEDKNSSTVMSSKI